MKYCKFIKSIHDGSKMMWKKNRKYLVTSETDEVYYFGNPTSSGISKDYENTAYKVINK